MPRKAVLMAVLVALMLAGGAQQAFGWGNGGDHGNGIGTHDWILARAIAFAGKDAAWVDRTAALRASDDPDSYNLNPYSHSFRESGIVRGAPHAVAENYAKAVSAYQAGNYTLASKYVGILSHYYTDACQPFHTRTNAKYHRKLHIAYEYKVGDYQHKTGNVTWWVSRRDRVPVTDVRAKAVSASKFARARYYTLRDSFRSSRRLSKTPLRITREVQGRAANDLADIIATIPTGGGLAPTPAAPVVRLSYSFPRQNQTMGAFVTCLSPTGQPMEGVGVKYVWRLPTGTVSTLRYTDENGKIWGWQNIGKSPLMETKYFTAYVPASSESTETSAWYRPTKVLADGHSGFKAWVSEYTPTQGTALTASALARDRSGNPVPGLNVIFSWSVDGYAERTVAQTDANGVARCTRPIDDAHAGVRYTFRAAVQAGGYNRSSTPTFIPR